MKSLIIADMTISVQTIGRIDFRPAYRYAVTETDTDRVVYSGTDLKGPADADADERQGMIALLGFLSAYGEGPADSEINRWCGENADELTIAEYGLRGSEW